MEASRDVEVVGKERRAAEDLVSNTAELDVFG